MCNQLANWSLTCAPFPLKPTQLGSTWFSVTIECHLNVGGVVRTRQPKFPVTLFVWCKHDTTMKDIEAMVYLPLNQCYTYAVGHWTTMFVCGHFLRCQVTWTPGWVGIKKVSGTRHYYLMGNPKTELSQVGTSGKEAMVTATTCSQSLTAKEINIYTYV